MRGGGGRMPPREHTPPQIVGMELFGVLMIVGESHSLEIQIILKPNNYGTAKEFVDKLRKEIGGLEHVESITIAKY